MVHEFAITQQIKDLGISRVCVKGKTLLVYNNVTTPIDCEYDNENLALTKKNLRKAFATSGHFDIEIVDQVIMWFTEVWATSDEGEIEDTRETTADKVLTLVKEHIQELFINQYGEPYVAVKINDHLETLHLKHERFRNWVGKLYYDQAEKGHAPNSESITTVVNILTANAQFGGNQKELFLRVASNDGNDISSYLQHNQILYDLTNKDWEIVKITPDGWSIERTEFAVFRRYNARPQVYPSKTYDDDVFDEFIKLLNVTNSDDKLLLKCYMISVLIPGIEKVILGLYGSRGAGKSSMQEFIKIVIDPCTILTFKIPKDVFELIQQLDHNYIAFYNNVSKLDTWVSDMFCSASTGEGASKRALFTDDDDKVYNYKRNVGFNGINLVAIRPDLLDRLIIIKVERISEKDQITKTEMRRRIENIRPKLLGYIFDMLVKYLKFIQSGQDIKFDKLPRMSDFAKTAEIISRCMGNKNNEFMDAYFRNIELQTDEILNTSLVASAVVKLMSGGTWKNEKYQDEEYPYLERWNGDATKLLGELDLVVGDKVQRNKWWPKLPNILSRRLNEVKANLLEGGLQVEEGNQDRATRIKNIVISRVQQGTGNTVHIVQPFGKKFYKNDANDVFGGPGESEKGELFCPNCKRQDFETQEALLTHMEREAREQKQQNADAKNKENGWRI